MKIKHFLLATTALLAMGYLSSASAAAMRCGTHLIQDGNRQGPGKYEVLKKCGEPVERFGNTWVYEKGGTYILTFRDDGQLQSIKR
jgi:hypothetical protein